MGIGLFVFDKLAYCESPIDVLEKIPRIHSVLFYKDIVHYARPSIASIAQWNIRRSDN